MRASLLLFPRELGISPRTVEKIRAQLMERYGVHNAVALMSRISGMPPSARFRALAAGAARLMAALRCCAGR